jgi:hypothetical protein
MFSSVTAQVTGWLAKVIPCKKVLRSRRNGSTRYGRTIMPPIGE